MSKTLLQKRKIKVQKVEVPRHLERSDERTKYLKEQVLNGETFDFPETSTAKLEIFFEVFNGKLEGNITLHLFGKKGEYVSYFKTLITDDREFTFNHSEVLNELPLNVSKVCFSTNIDGMEVDFDVRELVDEEMGGFFHQRTQ